MILFTSDYRDESQRDAAAVAACQAKLYQMADTLAAIGEDEASDFVTKAAARLKPKPQPPGDRQETTR